MYERLELKAGETVLELGCGTGLLWQKNARRLPERLHLVLTDRSEGMLEKARETLSVFQELFEAKGICVEYGICDADSLALEKENYDCIIANHMLYHVKSREACLGEIAHGLKPQGRFLCSTIGDSHMRQLHEIVAAFDARIEMPFRSITKGFRLENAMPQLQPHFRRIERMDQENDLIVDDIDVIYDYISYYPGNAAYIL